MAANIISKQVMEAVTDYRSIYDKREENFCDKKKDNARSKMSAKLGISACSRCCVAFQESEELF